MEELVNHATPGRAASVIMPPMPQKPRRIAAIDVGTNSIHMIIVECRGRSCRVIDKEKEMVLLGEGSLGGEPLTEEAIGRAVEAISRMAEIARRGEVDHIEAVATSAVREAPNRRRFAREVEKSAGVPLRIISGHEEADLIFRAVRSAVDFQGETALCIDIGGGSLELIAGSREEIHYATSEPLGALRLTEKFLQQRPADRRRDSRLQETRPQAAEETGSSRSGRRFRFLHRDLGNDHHARGARRREHGLRSGRSRNALAPDAPDSKSSPRPLPS
jgi:exopolyphosphatase / guanosine-5'-triphosphate,3'-diphosphate pyrophosphatase